MSICPNRMSLHLLRIAVCTGVVSCANTGRTVSSEWQADILWTAPAKLGGCAVGELAPRSNGSEIVAVSITGEIHRLHREGGGWRHRVIAKAPGELIQVAIGDADPTSPGNEVLAVGMKTGTEDDGGPGMAWLVTNVDSRAPVLVPLLEDSALIHAGCIADVDPDRPGDEIVVAGFGLKVHVLAHDGAGYLQSVVCELDGPAKQVVGWRGGAAIACANGELVFVEKLDGVWQKRVLATGPAGLARLGASSEHIAVARDDGALWLLDATGAGRVVHQESQKLRGAVCADLEPDRPGMELAAAGYEGRIVVLAEDEAGKWLSVEVWKEDSRFHHLSSGEVDAAGIGLELVACGYSGNIILVRRTKVVR